MARRYPKLDRLFALLVSLVVTTSGSAGFDSDFSDFTDDGDGSAVPADVTLMTPATLSTDRARRSALAISHDVPQTALISVVADEQEYAALLQRALGACRDAGDLKVIISTNVAPSVVAAVAEPMGFIVSRAVREHERTIIELYTNLYIRPTNAA